MPGADNIKADPFSPNRAASPIQPASDFESKIYAVAIENKNFSDQISKQCSDSIISMAKHLISNGLEITTERLKRVRKRLRVENDMLTKSRWPVLPLSLCKFVVAEIHSIARYGIEKTYSILKDRFYWPNTFGYVTIFVSSCQIYGKVKCETSPHKTPLIPLAIPEASMQFISVDIATLPEDDNGYKYIFLIGDIFSKYIEAVPLRDQSAPTAVDTLLHH